MTQENKLKEKGKTKRLIWKDSEQIRGILEDLGYKLFDCGKSWRTKAIFRDGANPISIQVYKDSGVWIDFASGGQGRPFEALIRLSAGGDAKQYDKLLNQIGGEFKTDVFVLDRKSPQQLITMDKVYPDSCLESLFPNYHFYQKKEISEETQKFFKLGLSSKGKMYRRIVFPIFDSNKQIIGFSGRHVEGHHPIKWKHLGRKTNWVYPAFVPNKKTVDEIIDECGEVYLVESIGDCMALHEQGIKNSLIYFGVMINPAILAYLSSKPLKRIIIVPNNDQNSERNNGFIGGIKIMIKLSRYFNLDQLLIRFPPNKHNDLGEAHQEGRDFSVWKNTTVDKKAQLAFIKKTIKEEGKSFSASNASSVNKFLKLIDGA